ncbi:hypothetical protein CK230_01010 [Mesorhizobium sp. WSM3859]|nr:hypothetical protein CK230_01010 [Mesorhizobium sp. WSM3859]
MRQDRSFVGFKQGGQMLDTGKGLRLGIGLLLPGTHGSDIGRGKCALKKRNEPVLDKHDHPGRAGERAADRTGMVDRRGQSLLLGLHEIHEQCFSGNVLSQPLAVRTALDDVAPGDL